MDGGESLVASKQVKTKRRNIILLSVLGLLIVGLIIIALILLTLNRRVEKRCLNSGDGYDMSVCIGEIYSGEGKDDAMLAYEAAINKAYDEGNEKLFYELLFDRATDLISRSGDCATAMSSIGDNRVEELPVSSEKGVYYSRVIGLTMTCNENEMEELYKNKLMEVNNSGEIEEYSF